MSMDDNYIMAKNMELLANENPALHKEIDILRKQLEIAKERIIEAMTYESCPAGVWNILNNALQLIESKGKNIEKPAVIE